VTATTQVVMQGHGPDSSHMTDECQTMQEQASQMKEAQKNMTQVELSHQNCKREQQKQKEQTKLHEIIMKDVSKLMQEMFKQLHQHHHLDDNSNINKSHQLESMDNITVSECFNLSDFCQPPTKKTKTQHFASISTAILEKQVSKSRSHKLESYLIVEALVLLS
jgi:hypothetical protein